MKTVLSLLAALCLVGSVAAQCCGPNCQVPSRVDPPAMSLTRVPGADQWGVYLHGRQVGTFDAAGRKFRPYDEKTDRWGDEVGLDPVTWAAAGACKCVKCKCAEDPVVGQSWQEHGVDEGKLRKSRYVVNGREVSQGEAHRAVGDAIPDESKKLTVTLIGSKAERDKVAADLRTLDPATAARVNVWSVPPDHHSLKDTETGQVVGKTDGHPTVYVQAPDGKVLHRQDDAVQAVEAVRKAVKGYDPAKDPDLRKPSHPVDPAAPSSNLIPICCLVAVGAFVLWSRSQRS